MGRFLIYPSVIESGVPVSLDGAYLVAETTFQGAGVKAVNSFAIAGQYYIGSLDTTEKFSVGYTDSTQYQEGWQSGGVDANAASVTKKKPQSLFFVFSDAVVDDAEVSEGYLIRSDDRPKASVEAINTFSLEGNFWVASFSNEPKKATLYTKTSRNYTYGSWPA